jgi:hypothetical protein
MTPEEMAVATDRALLAVGYANVRSEVRIEGEEGCFCERLITSFVVNRGSTETLTTTNDDDSKKD